MYFAQSCCVAEQMLCIFRPARKKFYFSVTKGVFPTKGVHEGSIERATKKICCARSDNTSNIFSATCNAIAQSGGNFVARIVEPLRRQTYTQRDVKDDGAHTDQ